MRKVILYIKSVDQVHIISGRQVQNTGHRSQVTGQSGHCFTNTECIPETLVKANLRPKNFCLGLIRLAFTSACLGYFLYW